MPMIRALTASGSAGQVAFSSVKSRSFALLLLSLLLTFEFEPLQVPRLALLTDWPIGLSILVVGLSAHLLIDLIETGNGSVHLKDLAKGELSC